MIIIRNVFHCKPGQAKALVKKFKDSLAASKGQHGLINPRVLTDVTSTFWTVVMESEAKSLGDWERAFEAMSANPEARKPMEGYMDLVTGGHREIFKVE